MTDSKVGSVPAELATMTPEELRLVGSDISLQKLPHVKAVHYPRRRYGMKFEDLGVSERECEGLEQQAS